MAYAKALDESHRLEAGRAGRLVHDDTRGRPGDSFPATLVLLTCKSQARVLHMYPAKGLLRVLSTQGWMRQRGDSHAEGLSICLSSDAGGLAYNREAGL